MGLRITGFVLLCTALFIVATVLYRNSGRADIPLVFAPSQILDATWMRYRDAYVEKSSGRTVDPMRDNVTTSEGQSYTMLRAVWLGDKVTFDQSWKFAKESLQHKDDSLFSWLYGKRSNGSYGVLTDKGGSTSASDADIDIALALIFGYSRWQHPLYINDARAIVSDIWEKEVIEINGTYYLTANNLGKTSTTNTVLLNPSYFSPHAYRIFAKIDPKHPWMKLVDSSYKVLQKSIVSPLDASHGSLPPDWIALNKKSGALSPTYQTNLSTNYGYDAMRVPWRIALDWQWNHDMRAKDVLGHMVPLADSWAQKGILTATYNHSGAPVETYESPAMYGGAIGYFMLTNPNEAKKVYTNKLVYLFDPDTNDWKRRLSYYDDNWAWFGIGLYNNLLPNLSVNLPTTAYSHKP